MADIGSITSTAGGWSSSVGNNTIAGNFQTFLTLLTTQLKSQNPLDPLDTNQFTQQLVQFAQVEQQLRSNDQLSSLVALQKTTQASQALNFVGQVVAVNGTTTTLADGQANWGFTATRPATATITVTNAAGQTAYTGSYTMNAGPQTFTWDGKGTDGTPWPEGKYTISITAKDASGNAVAITPEVLGVVDSVDLTQDPPLLSINGQNYTVDQIKRVVRT